MACTPIQDLVLNQGFTKLAMSGKHMLLTGGLTGLGIGAGALGTNLWNKGIDPADKAETGSGAALNRMGSFLDTADRLLEGKTNLQDIPLRDKLLLGIPIAAGGMYGAKKIYDEYKAR